MLQQSILTIVDDVIPDPKIVKHEVSALLKPHPVPQGFTATRGFILELANDTAEVVLNHMPVLKSIITLLLRDDCSFYLLAGNETPPSSSQLFAMRPHIDRRWQHGAFTNEAPLFTSVLFLDFPKQTAGGELVVFMNEVQYDAAGHLPREHARRALATFDVQMITPRPGRLCTMQGTIPHAVMGYDPGEPKTWRLSLVFAAFR